MCKLDKNTKAIPEQNKVSGLAYVYSDNGIELPVLDITHPSFVSSIDEKVLENLCQESAQKAKAFKEMPDSQRKFIIANSYIYGYFQSAPAAGYLGGMSTYMLKLGPYLIGGGKERDLDRKFSMGVGSIAARMRLKNLCKMQAYALIPSLVKFPQKKLCFINIAGGAASDSINTLILILKENPALLKNREIEIVVFDIDTNSSNFAGRCVEELQKENHHFHGLNVTFNYIHSNWENTDRLVEYIKQNKDSILMGTSEGGLFEYGSEEVIVENLNALYDNSPNDMRIAGSILHDLKTVDPTVPAMGEASGASLQFLGLDGLTRILKKTKWKLDGVNQKNPIYIIVCLVKDM